MNLEQLAAIGEIISSVAVVVTLIYLAMQTRQMKSALNASSRAQLMSADVQFVIEDAKNPITQYQREWIRNIAPTGLDLTDEEELQTFQRLVNLLAGLVRIREFAWFQYRDGLLDEQAFNGYLATLVRNMNFGYGPLLWEIYKPELDPKFVAYVEERLS